MRSIIPALILVAACSAPPPLAQTSAAATPEPENSDLKTLLMLDLRTELGEQPATVKVPLGDVAAKALEIARDPKRALVLRIEGISVTRQPGVVYDVHVAGAAKESGVLSFYGAEESNGQFVAAFPIDEAVAGGLKKDARELPVVFTPRGLTGEDGRETIHLEGRATFTRIRLVEEKLPL